MVAGGKNPESFLLSLVARANLLDQCFQLVNGLPNGALVPQLLFWTMSPFLITTRGQ